tara:strand:+ start:2877 stop:3086 length:210 start_codon:yes stop_codon:yes gene_type:complete
MTNLVVLVNVWSRVGWRGARLPVGGGGREGRSQLTATALVERLGVVALSGGMLPSVLYAGDERRPSVIQ